MDYVRESDVLNHTRAHLGTKFIFWRTKSTWGRKWAKSVLLRTAALYDLWRCFSLFLTLDDMLQIILLSIKETYVVQSIVCPVCPISFLRRYKTWGSRWARCTENTKMREGWWYTKAWSPSNMEGVGSKISLATIKLV